MCHGSHVYPVKCYKSEVILVKCCKSHVDTAERYVSDVDKVKCVEVRLMQSQSTVNMAVIQGLKFSCFIQN